jgi:hypothetical protein
MSKLTRVLVLGAVLAAMNLAGMTAIAQAQANNADTITRHRALGQLELLIAEDHDAPRPPLERQVGESYRYYHDALAAQAQAATDDAVELFGRGERASQQQNTAGDTQQPPTESQVGESWRHQTGAPVRPAEPNGQSGWLVASLGVLAAALALSAGLAVRAAKRPGRRVRAGQAA